MATLLSYIIKSMVASGLLYTYYQLALRNKKFHGYNRWYLLLTVLISLVIPLVHIPWYPIQKTASPALNSILSLLSARHIEQPAALSVTGRILLGSAGAISLLLLGLMLSKILAIYRLKKKHTNTRVQNINFIETDNSQAPFSFFNNLFWKEGMPTTGQGEKIFDHELAHIRQGHSYDKLFTQTVACICWVNPFYWLIQRELNMVHEFIADGHSIPDGDTASFALMLLQSYDHGAYLTPTHSFYHSPVKRRLHMIAAPNHTPYSPVRKLLALPLMVMLLAFSSFNMTRDNIPPAGEQGRRQKLLDERQAREMQSISLSHEIDIRRVTYL